MLALVLGARHLRLRNGDLADVDPLVVDEVPSVSGVKRLDGDRVPIAVKCRLKAWVVRLGECFYGLRCVYVFHGDHGGLSFCAIRASVPLLSYEFAQEPVCSSRPTQRWCGSGVSR